MDIQWEKICECHNILNFDSLFQKTSTFIIEQTGASSTTLITLDGDELEPVSFYHLADRSTIRKKNISVDKTPPLLKHVINSAEPYFIQDIDELIKLSTFLGIKVPHSTVVLPLAVKSRTGAIFLVHYFHEHTFSDKEKETWGKLKRAISLLFCPYFCMKEARERDTLIKLIEEISIISMTSPDTRSLLKSIVEKIKSTLNLDVVSIMVREGDVLKIKEVVGFNKDFMLTEIPLSGKGITVHAFKTGKDYYAPDVLRDPYYLYSGPQIRSEAAFPLCTGKKIVGVMDIMSRKVRGISETQRRIMRAVSSIIGYAIENARLRRETMELALHDPLTEVYNRRGLEIFFEREAKKAKRFNYPLAILFIDLDRFKEINDKYGHNIGDKILKQTAQILAKNIRGIDIFARVGGDEFVAILINADLDVAKFVASRLREKLSSCGIPVTFSLGISIYPKDGKDLSTLINHADRACYKAKSKGGNSIALS